MQIKNYDRNQIASSAIFFSLFTPNFLTDNVCALQLGVAIMLNKPIVLLVRQGTHIPEKVKKVSDYIEYFESDNSKSIERATKLVMNRLIKDGVIK